MAREHQIGFGHKGKIALVVSLLVGGSPAWAQDNAPPPATPLQVMPAPFGLDCKVDTVPTVIESPLPNVAAALQQRKVIKILAIGAASVVRRGVRRGGHTEEAEKILENAIKGLDVVMINRGVSGELSEQAAVRIKNEVALNEPDLVLWQVGTNDALAYIPLDVLETTIVDTVHWLKDHKVDVVLVGLQYVDRMAQDDHYKAVRDLLRRIAVKENVMIVRRYEAQRLLLQAETSGGGLEPDEFQRSELGNACLAQYIARAITLGLFGQSLRIRPSVNPPMQPQN
jgi:acyl-CoA thioesterase-1